jgi:hypothetical protein
MAKKSKWAVSGLTILVVGILVASSLIGGFLVMADSQAGGIQKAWTFSETDSNGKPANISLMYRGTDGTIYAFETQSYYPNYFMAFDPNGNLKWRTGVNAQPFPVQGADGGFYYVDWPNIMYWLQDRSKAGWYNLTSLDSEGNYRWSYVVDNGSLAILATYDDGTVIAHHYNSQYDNSTGKYVTLLDTLIEISPNGTELWQINRPLPQLTFQDPRVASNGTFLMNAYDAGGTYTIGIPRDGKSFYVVPSNFIVGLTPGPFSTKDGVVYDVRREYIDSNTSVVSAYASNLSDGGQRWKTVLENSNNPDDFVAGYWVGQDAFVDRDGTIYCGDIVGNHTYALNPDGSIKWQRPYMGVIWSTFSDGGMLVSDIDSIKRIGSDGVAAWQYETGPLESEYSRVLLGPNQTVYASLGTTIFSLVHPNTIAGNGIVLIFLVAFNLVVITLYGRMQWTRRKTKKMQEMAVPEKKGQGNKKK